MTEKQLKEITEVLSKPSTIEWFKKTYGEEFINHHSEGGRLHFDMGLTHSQDYSYIRKVISYNNDIIGLFYNHSDYCKGFGLYRWYPVTASCWKGSMYISCLSEVRDNLSGYGTRKIIGMILGYEEW